MEETAAPGYDDEDAKKDDEAPAAGYGDEVESPRESSGGSG